MMKATLGKDSNAPRQTISNGSTTTRRTFVQAAALGGFSGILSGKFNLSAEPTTPSTTAPISTGSDVGSLYPFIQSQAIKGEFPLSYLNPRFRSMRRWKATAQKKLLDLLHYTPPQCAPSAEILERVDCGDFIRERVRFNTTPDIRVPAYVLVPKQGRKPAPAIVALHDHGGFYMCGKEKLVDLPDENGVLTEFKRLYYGGR